MRALCPVLVLLFASSASWQIGPFTRPSDAKPIITPTRNTTFRDAITGKAVHWEALHTFNPAAIVRGGKVYVLYRAEDDSGKNEIGGHTSRLGLAVSNDGIHFQRDAEPVFYPANDDQKSREWPGGCEDPRLVEAEDGSYVLTYTQWNGKTWRAAVATSRDLHHWTKYGPLFPNREQYKSAGIVISLQDGRLKAVRIDGRYVMYWGEVQIRTATSTDLIHWTADETPVLQARPGRFDSGFPEVGPPPVLTSQGIVLLYNGKSGTGGEYSVGEALFSPQDVKHVLARTDDQVFKPELAWERSGQYAAGTTFAEGLVYFHGKWFVYYGAADSSVGVAVSKATN